ncbi:MAG: hypothetical protein SYC29_07875 [Planctomycetota bacterium]|nr:hypothetical protein [Planctomycetota bacterium]
MPRTLPLAALGALLLGCAVWAFPEPALVPYRWELDFQPGELRLYVDPIDETAWWYFTYKVVNNTGDDQLWAPSFVLFTDAGEILTSGRDVPTRIEEDITSLIGNELLLMQNEAIGELFQGPEHAREGVVVWPAREIEVNELSLFIAGISGETARIANPLTGEELILRKTLQRDYLIRGKAITRGSEPIEFLQQRWVLR